MENTVETRVGNKISKLSFKFDKAIKPESYDWKREFGRLVANMNRENNAFSSFDSGKLAGLIQYAVKLEEQVRGGEGFDEKLKQAQNANDVLRGDNGKLQTAFDSLEKELTNENKKLQTRIEELVKENGTLKGKNTKLQNKVKEFETVKETDKGK